MSLYVFRGSLLYHFSLDRPPEDFYLAVIDGEEGN